MPVLMWWPTDWPRSTSLHCCTNPIAKSQKSCTALGHCFELSWSLTAIWYSLVPGWNSQRWSRTWSHGWACSKAIQVRLTRSLACDRTFQTFSSPDYFHFSQNVSLLRLDIWTRQFGYWAHPTWTLRRPVLGSWLIQWSCSIFWPLNKGIG